MVPLRPSSSRSLKSAGSQSPSSSQISVLESAQISSSRCQSALLRARSETSRPSTIPALPRPTSATRRWKALTVGGARAGLSLVGVDHDDPLGRPAELNGALAQRVLTLAGLGVVVHLPQRRLAYIQERGPGQMLGADLRRGRARAHRHSPPDGARQRHRRERVDELIAAGRGPDPGLDRGRGCRGSPGARPRRDAAALEQREPQPPPRRLAAERIVAQLLIALDVARSVIGLIGRPRFRAARRGPARARSSADARARRSAARSTRPTPRAAARDRPQAARARTRRPRRSACSRAAGLYLIDGTRLVAL